MGEISQRSPAHRAPAALKLAVALALLCLTVLLPRQLTSLYWVPAGILLALWPLCGMPLRYALRRLLIAQFFILGIASLSVISPATRPVVISAIAKGNLSILIMLLLTWSTPFHEILGVLRRIGFPAIMLTILALMYRYLPVLAEESRRMERARASRTFIHTRRLAWSNLSTIIARLFVRSADRAERIYLAMCARGWK